MVFAYFSAARLLQAAGLLRFFSLPLRVTAEQTSIPFSREPQVSASSVVFRGLFREARFSREERFGDGVGIFFNFGELQAQPHSIDQ